jgi:carbohydrate/starch-binding protein with CBM21 domain
MPYTPPSRRSPATSSGNSPSLTRNHSYDKTNASDSRPDLPRSRSAAYIHKHRRTPSLADNKSPQESYPISYSDGTATVVSGPALLTSPVTKLVAADKFTASPIEAGSSEDDEDRGRSRQIQDLADSLRESIQVPKRQSSPKRNSDGPTGLPVDSVVRSLQFGSSAAREPAPITPEALKIAHSRSSSEVQLASNQNGLEAYTQSSPGDSDDEGLEMKRGPLLRKKSGELVKPALRGSSGYRRPLSAPGTPTFPKAVHFNEDMEQVRHFLQVDRPIAVSAGSSPVEIYDSESDYPFNSDVDKRPRAIEWEIKTLNFPKDSHERQCLPVRVEQLYLSRDFKTMIGIVAVANLAFEKNVAARFTLDYWKTTSEVAAEFSPLRPQKTIQDGFDRFQFGIKLSEQANLQNRTMYLCVRYTAAGQEHWDNNGGNNFQIDFVRKLPAKQAVKPTMASSLGAIPRSRNTSSQKLPRPRSFPASSADDEFSTSFDSPFRRRKDVGADRKDGSGSHSTAQDHSRTHRLSNRYDFNASLHAALTTAQNALGDRSGLRIKTSALPKPVAAVPLSPPKQAQVLNASRPDLNSAEYKDLIQKFCYFGSSTNSGDVTEDTTPVPEEAQAKAQGLQQMDGPIDSSSESNASSVDSSASNSPPSPKVQLHQVEQQDSKASSRSSSTSAILSLSPRLLPYRTPSPALSSAYQEFPHQGLSVQTTQC